MFARLPPHLLPGLFLLGTWGALMVWLQLNALQLRADGLWAGHLNVWSDWPLHMGMAQGFAQRPWTGWLDHHPMYAHGGLTYPFVVNLMSGLLMRAGLGLDWAMTLPTLLASVLTPCLLYLLFYLLLQRRWVAVLAVCLFYLGSGPGGFAFLWEVLREQNWAALLYPPIEVSRLDRYDWYSGNALTGMLLPQRAFVFGFPLALLSLCGLLYAVRGGRPVRRAQALAVGAGVLAGLMPLLHTHSYLALALIGPCVAVCHWSRWRIWLAYAVPACLLSLPLSWLFLANGLGSGQADMGNSALNGHLHWAPGFAAPGGFFSWLQMWWALWGLAWPALLLAVLLLIRRWPERRLLWMVVLAGLLCFGFANLVMIQPNRWDNSKLFLWTYCLWAPLWAWMLVQLFQWRRSAKLLAVLLTLGLATTGGLEVWRLARVDKGSYMIANAPALAAMRMLREVTPADAVFATHTTHNHPVMALAGRPILLGFTGWMANLGFEYGPREQALREIYTGGDAAHAALQRYQVDYVVIGPDEQAAYEVARPWFEQHLPRVLHRNGYQVFAVPH